MKFRDRLIYGVALSIGAFFFGVLTTLIFDYLTGYKSSELTTTIIILFWVAILFTRFNVIEFGNKIKQQ
jgi:hypothetical protein